MKNMLNMILFFSMCFLVSLEGSCASCSKNVERHILVDQYKAKKRSLKSTVKKECPCAAAASERKKKELDNKLLSISKDKKNWSDFSNNVSFEQMREAVASWPIIVSVIPAIYFEKWRIPNSINIPYEELGEAVKGWPKGRPIMLYCFIGKTSFYAYELLKNLGFENVFAYKGGLMEWVEKGGEIEGSGSKEELFKLIKDLTTQFN